ncbi:MAG: hypothetical protein M3R04_02935, partial [bacterium]|nr:hypothetical protein [bacterium]
PATTALPTHYYNASSLHRSSIESMYKAQIQAGLVDPNAKSPYEGTPQGPVAVDPTPRPPKLLAQRSHRMQKMGRSYMTAGQDHIAVKPLDDPANPYRGQYGAWDYWMVDQHGKRNPIETAFRKQQDAQPKFTNKADGSVQTGSSAEPWRNYVHYTPPLREQWRDFTVHVDEQGWVVPQLEWRPVRWRWLAEPATWTSLYAGEAPDHHYTFRAGGEMPAVAAAALLGELRGSIPSMFPPAPPEWMAAAPPYTLLVTPEGEFITEGPLGSWSEDWKLRDPGWQADRNGSRSAHGWYHYSADGTLLGSIKGYSWLPLLMPRYSELKSEGEAQGYDVMDYRGYLIWLTKRVESDHLSGGEIVRKWDYDGTEVARDLTFYRPGDVLREWSWEDVVREQRGVLPD